MTLISPMMYCAEGLRCSCSSLPWSFMAQQSRSDISVVKIERSMSPSVGVHAQ